MGDPQWINEMLISVIFKEKVSMDSVVGTLQFRGGRLEEDKSKKFEQNP